MSKKVKRIVVAFATLVVMLFPMTALAYDSGGAKIELISGWIWRSGVPQANGTVSSNGDNGVFGFSVNASGFYNEWSEVSAKFSFSSQNNYGTLSMSVTCSGNTVGDRNIELYDMTRGGNGTLIASWRPNSDNFMISYKGNIPSLFRLQFYTAVPSQSVSDYLFSTYYDVSFSPESILEQEEGKAQSQGNQSINEGMNAIEDKGSSFVDSMGGLVSSMSYSGTECAWTFPQVKMPAIEGVMEERVLIEEQPIDFTRWINAIPAPILLLIQSVLTMGLIVYCFKELYDTISYVLTLRGGGSNE